MINDEFLLERGSDSFHQLCLRLRFLVPLFIRATSCVLLLLAFC